MTVVEQNVVLQGPVGGHLELFLARDGEAKKDFDGLLRFVREGLVHANYGFLFDFLEGFL